jgi:RNase P subunit RPR2
MNEEQLILHRKNIEQIYKLSQTYAIHSPDLSRFYYDQFLKYLSDINVDASNLSHKACGKCCNVFVPGITCQVSEESRKNLKIDGMVFDWSLKENKSINFINHTKKKTNSIIV